MDRGRIVREFALSAIGSPYVYGGTGMRCTPDYRLARMAQYPAYADAIKAQCPRLMGTRQGCAGCRYEGMDCFDCAGFVRRGFQAAGISLPSGASTQWRTGNWAYKGPLAPRAFQGVCALYRESGDSRYPMRHTGISLGDGRVADARGHQQGVLLVQGQAYPWTHYAVPNGMEEEMLPPFPEPLELSVGAKGGAVRRLQERLMALGYPLRRFGADSIFGRETAGALRAFQHVAGLPPTGRGDRKTLALLNIHREENT